MAAKKKQSKIDPTGMVPRSKTQPTAAFTSPGKKPTTTRPRNAAEKPKETKRTPIKNAESGFAGSGTPLGTSLGLSKNLKSNRKIAEAVAIAASPGIGSVVKKGVVKAVNDTYVFGKTVVHGSPQKGLKQITPQKNPGAMPNSKVAYGFNAKASPKVSYSGTSSYAEKNFTKGTYYVGKAKRSSIIRPGDKDFNPTKPAFFDKNKDYVPVREPIKRLKEIPGTSKNIPRQIAKKSPGATAGGAASRTTKKLQYELRKKIQKYRPVYDEGA